MGWKLADLFVQFVATGMGDVAQAMDVVHADLNKTSAAAKAVGASAKTSFATAEASAKVLSSATGAAGKAMAGAFGGASAAAKTMGNSTSQGMKLGAIQAAILAENVDKVKLKLFSAQSAARGLGGESVKQMGEALERTKLLGQQLSFLQKAAPEAGKQVASGFWGRISSGADETIKSMSKSWAIIRTDAAWAFAGITATLGGFIRAGSQGTAVGEMLGFQMTRLSHTIAGLFRPELQMLTQGIGKAATWLNSLSAAQKDNIVWWAKVTVGVLGFIALAPTVVGAIGTIVGAVFTLGKALWAMSAAGGPLLALIGVAAALVVGVKIKEEIDKGIASMKKAIGPVSNDRGAMGMAGSQMSSIQDTWKRIQEATYDGAGDPAKQQLEETKKGNSFLQQIAQAISNLAPAVVP